MRFVTRRVVFSLQDYLGSQLVGLFQSQLGGFHSRHPTDS